MIIRGDPQFSATTQDGILEATRSGVAFWREFRYSLPDTAP
jgi:hypothetical protein